MSPAGLYRYNDSLDTLITELVTDTYTDLADTVEAAVAVSGTARDRLRAGMHAYRDWARTDPQRFLLIFGTRIPGYIAPEDGPTEQANRCIGAVRHRNAHRLVPALVSAYAHFHGLVTLEILGQLTWLYPDPALFYTAETPTTSSTGSCDDAQQASTVSETSPEP